MPFDGVFSPLHWLIVGVVILLVIPADDLPNVARKIGTGYREFRRVNHHFSQGVSGLLDDLADRDTDPGTPRNTTGEADTAMAANTDRARRVWPPTSS